MDVELQIDELQELVFDAEEPQDIGLSVNEQIVGGSTDYSQLRNKPQINNVELVDNKTFDDLGLSGLSNIDIENILT